MRVLCWLNSKFVPNAFDSRRIQHASLWCMVHAAGSSSRRLLVFHTASNEEAEEQQSAKELKGAEHIEKHQRKRWREGEKRNIFTLLFRAISSKLDSTGLLLQIVTTAERLTSVPTVSDTTLPASAPPAQATALLFLASLPVFLLLSIAAGGVEGGREYAAGFFLFNGQLRLSTVDCRLWTVFLIWFPLLCRLVFIFHAKTGRNKNYNSNKKRKECQRAVLTLCCCCCCSC